VPLRSPEAGVHRIKNDFFGCGVNVQVRSISAGKKTKSKKITSQMSDTMNLNIDPANKYVSALFRYAGCNLIKNNNARE
jgi:hypothetical protein